MSADFKKNHSQFATGSKISPIDVVWCGDDSVVLYWFVKVEVIIKIKDKITNK